MDRYTIIGIIFFAIIIIGIIIYFYKDVSNTIAQHEDLTNQNQQYNQMMEQITELKQQSGQPGPVGKQGERGLPGPAGGTFLRQGVLRSLAYPDVVADRYYGSGANVGLFLNKGNYSSNQMWILTSDGLLQNQYGGCVDNDTNGNVFINSCNKSLATQKWTHDNNGRITSGTNKCLTTSQKMSPKSVPKIINQKPAKNGDGNVQTDVGIIMTPCDSNTYPLQQQWAFY